MTHQTLTEIQVEARTLRAQHMARLFRAAGGAILRLLPTSRPAGRTA